MPSPDDTSNPSSHADREPVDSGVFYAPDERLGAAGDRRVPAQVGPYRIVRPLGQGGMGVVYLAEQESPLRRQIALKLVKLGMDTEQVVARFQVERQAMAMMDHPGIARVFDAGATETGRPYFVMEYVEGTPVTAYCDRERMDTRARLRLFVEICHAVQHAHQKGVIHRDLKPSNVLVTQVDGRPQPKVIDFGIARATEGDGADFTRHTRDGQFVGTPEYMSPEQVSGRSDVDTRTDVYSLGVLLYELLTGARPLDLAGESSGSIDVMRRRIHEEEPPRPSTRVTGGAERAVQVARRRGSEPEALRDLLKGDLDWIVMKAMEKERERRYDSASEFAADVQRFLDDEPVRAAPPSTRYRLHKFVRRNRGPVAAACLLALALVAGTVISLALYLRAEEARMRAEQSAGRLELVNEFLLDMLDAADPSEMGRDVRVVDLLEGAAARLEARFGDQPDLEAGARYAIGSTYRGLGLYEESIENLERAVDLYRQSLGEDAAWTIDAMAGLGGALNEYGELEEAERVIRGALELNRARRGDDLATGKLMTQLGANLTGLGRYEEAQGLLEEGLEVTRAAVGEEDVATAGAMLNLGQLYLVQARMDEAFTLHARALEIRRDQLGDRHPSTLNAMSNHALVLLESRRAAEAEPLLRELLELSREVRGEGHQFTVLAVNNLAGALYQQGKMEEVETLLDGALQSLRTSLGETHPIALAVMHNLGVLKHRNGRPAEAEPLLRRALELREQVLGRGHRETGYSAAALGSLLLQTGRPAAAAPFLEMGVEIFTEVAGPEFERTIAASLDLAEALALSGRGEKARAVLASLEGRVSGAASERRAALLSSLERGSGTSTAND